MRITSKDPARNLEEGQEAASASVHMSVHVCVCVFVFVSGFVCVCLLKHTLSHRTHTHTHTHTHKHTQLCVCVLVWSHSDIKLSEKLKSTTKNDETSQTVTLANVVQNWGAAKPFDHFTPCQSQATLSYDEIWCIYVHSEYDSTGRHLRE